MPRPISRHKLPHTVTYSKFNSSGRDNSWDNPITVKYVRYEHNSKLVRDDKGNILKGTTLLFYDEVTSYPRGIIFSENDKVTINIGKANEKTLKVVAPSDTTGIADHHQEVVLQ